MGTHRTSHIAVAFNVHFLRICEGRVSGCDYVRLRLALKDVINSIHVLYDPSSTSSPNLRFPPQTLTISTIPPTLPYHLPSSFVYLSYLYLFRHLNLALL